MRTASLFLAGLVAHGCAQPGQPPLEAGAAGEGDGKAMTGPAPAVEVATYRSNGIAASGRLEGTLAVVDGCIMLQSPSSPDGVLVFFPEGQARWNPEDQTLTIAGERFRPGDRIWLTGGASSVGNYADRANVPRRCGRSGGFFAWGKANAVK